MIVNVKLQFETYDIIFLCFWELVSYEHQLSDVPNRLNSCHKNFGRLGLRVSIIFDAGMFIEKNL
jgi:hypothetical protein